MKIRNWFALNLLAVVLAGLVIGGWLMWRAIGAPSLPWDAFTLLGVAVLALLIDARNEDRAPTPSPNADAFEKEKEGEALTAAPSLSDPPSDSIPTGP